MTEYNNINIEIIKEADKIVEVASSHSFITFDFPSGYPIEYTSGNLPFNRLEGSNTIVRTIGDQNIYGWKIFNEYISTLAQESSGPVSHVAVFNENISPGLSPAYIRSINIPNFKTSLGMSISDISPMSSNSLRSNVIDEVGVGRLVFNDGPVFSGDLISSGTVSMRVAPSTFSSAYFPIFVSDPVTFSRTLFTRTTSQVKSDLGLNNVQNLALSGINFIAGSGLVGGGSLSSNRSFDIGQGDGITVTNDDISVDSSVVRLTDAQTLSSKTLINLPTISGNLIAHLLFKSPYNNAKIVFDGQNYEGAVDQSYIYHTSNGITFSNPNTIDIVSPLFTQNNIPISISGHQHTVSDITNFNSSVSGLIPVKNIISGTNITVSNVGGNFTINSTATGGSASISNSGQNRLLISDGSTSGIVGQTNLTFNGSLLNVTGSGAFSNNIIASGFVRSGGTSNQFLKADGSIDNNIYYLNSNPSGYALTAGKLNQFASTSSSELLSVISDETGSGLLVFNNSPNFSGIPLTPTAPSGTNTNQIASTAFVRTEISNLVASAPSTLDTLNELATALSGDPNFATTVTNNLAGKANLSGAIFTGSISGPSGNFTSLKVNNVDVSPSGHTHTSSNITDFNSSVSGLLPVKNIIGGSGIQVGSNSGDYTITAYGVAAASASSLITEVYNNTATTISRGSVVYINGGQGNLPTISLAIANGESGSSKTYGITAENIGSNNNGDVVVIGSLIDFNTEQFGINAGSTLYLSPTVSGGITPIKPLSPNHMVSVGTVVRRHPTQGVIEVRIQNGFELEELHNVAISGVSDGQFLQYNSASGLWVASSSGSFSAININGTGVSISGHTHTSSNITNFDSSVSGLLPVTDIIGGTNINISKNGSIYTVNVSGQLGLTGEEVDDRVFGLLVPSGGIVLNYDDFNNKLLISTSGLQPSGNYSLVGHNHLSSDITNFNNSVSGLINVKDIAAGSNVTVSNNNGIFTISSIGGGGGGGISPVSRGAFLLTSSSGIFNVPGGYTVGSLDVFLNGVKLFASGDYTASNGTSFTLTNPAPSGSVIEYLSLVPGTNFSSGGVVISNSGVNRLLVNDGSTSGIIAQSNLTFDGSSLNVNGSGIFGQNIVVSGIPTGTTETDVLLVQSNGTFVKRPSSILGGGVSEENSIVNSLIFG